MSAYVAKPGSIADRAIAFLQSQPAAGTEISTSVLAEAVRVSGSSLPACLEAALKAGAIFVRKKGGHVRSPLFWSLVDHSAKHAQTGEAISPANGSQKPDGGAPIPAAKAGRETPPKGANRAASAGQSHGAEGSASPAGRGNNVAPASGAAPAFQSPRFALWSNGVLQIERDAVGGAAPIVLLSPDETRALVRYLDRMSLDHLRDERTTEAA